MTVLKFSYEGNSVDTRILTVNGFVEQVSLPKQHESSGSI